MDIVTQNTLRCSITQEVSPRAQLWLLTLRSWCLTHEDFVCAPEIIPTCDLVELRCAGLIDMALHGERLHVWPVGGRAR